MANRRQIRSDVGKTTAAIAAFVLVAGTAVGDEPQVPKLGDAPAAPVVDDRAPTARPLPRILAICIDRGHHRCWGGARAEDCRPEGEVFARLPLMGGDPGAVLQSCWDEVR